MLPIAMSKSPFLALLTVMNISGKLVPMTIAVIVINFSLMFRLLAIFTALSTIILLLNEIKTMERINIIMAIGILSYLTSTFWEFFSFLWSICTKYVTNIKNRSIRIIPSILENTLGLDLLNKLSNISTENDVVIKKSIGSSFFTVSCFTFIGCSNEASPTIKKTFTIQLPITLAKAIVPFLLATLVNEIAISGAQVPNDTIVRATSILGTLHFIAMDDALSTKVSLALMITIKPITKNIYLSINITTFLFIIAKYSLQKKIDFAV